MPPRIVPLVAAGALALAMTGAAAPAIADGGHHDVVVTASASHRLRLPTDLPAGVMRFRVHGPAGENLQLARARGGAGPQQLADDGDLLNAKGDASGIERDFIAVGGVGTGHSVFVRLHPGTYYAIDTNAEKATAADVVTLHVHGDADHGRLLKPAATIEAVHEMDWAKRPARIPSHGVLRFVNASSDYHFVELAKLKDPSTTLAEVKKALQTNDQSIVDEHAIYDTGVVSPGRQQESTYRLPRGEYAVLCWWPGEHGVPHALMGMVRLIRVG